MTLQDRIDRILQQERRLRFPAFDADTAWAIGGWLHDTAVARGLAISFDVFCNGMTLVSHSRPGTRPDNADWIRRKRNLVLRTYASSYYHDLRLQLTGATLEGRGMPVGDYAASGGAFPIHVTGSGCIGSVVVSGLTGREDHDLAVEALAVALGIDPAEVALPA